MSKSIYSESHRRTVTKSLLWRFIGIFWTWGGAYVIILALPEEQKNAVTIATLVTVWHHSTRMLMYYFYERIWAKIVWGKIGSGLKVPPLSLKKKIQWATGTVTAIITIFWLLFYVTPEIKKNQKDMIWKVTKQDITTVK